MCVYTEDNQFLECLEYEQKSECKPTFSVVIKDVEVVEGSAARFDCKIEGGTCVKTPDFVCQELRSHSMGRAEPSHTVLHTVVCCCHAALTQCVALIICTDVSTAAPCWFLVSQLVSLIINH